MRVKISILLVFCTALFACKEEAESKVLAEAYGQKLYATELEFLLEGEVTKEDSVFITREYINSWVSRQVILHHSKQILTARERDKSEELKRYQNDLIVYETLNKMALQRIDTNFSKEQLLAYYEANIEEFELGENIIKIVFFSIPVNMENEDELWRDFGRGENYEELQKLAQDSGGNYYTDVESWVFFDDILKEIPINTYNQEHFLNNNKLIRIKQGSSRYFVKILDFRIKSGNSPFELEKDRIKKILFVKEQKESLKKLETELVEQAYNNNKVVTH